VIDFKRIHGIARISGKLSKALFHAGLRPTHRRYEQSYPQKLGTYDKTMTHQALSLLFESEFEK
jgi:hypothetical protein